MQISILFLDQIQLARFANAFSGLLRAAKTILRSVQVLLSWGLGSNGTVSRLKGRSAECGSVSDT